MSDTPTAPELDLYPQLKVYYEKLEALKDWLLSYQPSEPPSTSTPLPHSSTISYPNTGKVLAQGIEEGNREEKTTEDVDLYKLPIKPTTWPLRLYRIQLMGQSGLLEEEQKTLIDHFIKSYDFQEGPPVEDEEIRTLIRDVERNEYLGHELLKPFKNKVQTTKYGTKK